MALSDICDTALRQEQRFADNATRYKLALKGSGATVWDWNIVDDTLYLADEFFTLIDGVPAADPHYSMDLLRERIHPEDIEDALAIMRAHIEREFFFMIECRLRREDNSYVWVCLRGQAEWDERRRPVRMAGTIQDISDRRAAMRQLSASNDALERFAYICSHDLKEPARIVDNFSRLFEKKYASVIDERGKECLDHIRISAQRMQEMINDILAYSQTDHKHIVAERVDTRAEVDKALEHLRLAIEESGAVIHREELPVIQADRTQIFQVLLNLISNALKFKGKAVPEITVGAQRDGVAWRFYVRDNGIGMRQEDAEKVFKVFRRLHNATEYAGTGIGLSICHRVITKHKGRIWVESSPGNGAVFYFTLPATLTSDKDNHHVCTPKKTA